MKETRNLYPATPSTLLWRLSAILRDFSAADFLTSTKQHKTEQSTQN